MLAAVARPIWSVCACGRPGKRDVPIFYSTKSAGPNLNMQRTPPRRPPQCNSEEAASNREPRRKSLCRRTISPSLRLALPCLRVHSPPASSLTRPGDLTRATPARMSASTSTSPSTGGGLEQATLAGSATQFASGPVATPSTPASIRAPVPSSASADLDASDAPSATEGEEAPPTEQEMAAAARVLAYFTHSSDRILAIRNSKSPHARDIRKGATAFAATFNQVRAPGVWGELDC